MQIELSRRTKTLMRPRTVSMDLNGSGLELRLMRNRANLRHVQEEIVLPFEDRIAEVHYGSAGLYARKLRTGLQRTYIHSILIDSEIRLSGPWDRTISVELSFRLADRHLARIPAVKERIMQTG